MVGKHRQDAASWITLNPCDASIRRIPSWRKPAQREDAGAEALLRNGRVYQRPNRSFEWQRSLRRAVGPGQVLTGLGATLQLGFITTILLLLAFLQSLAWAVMYLWTGSILFVGVVMLVNQATTGTYSPVHVMGF